MYGTDEAKPVRELLKGATVGELFVSKDEQFAIYFIVKIGESKIIVAGTTDGDCCSESWWADAIGVKQLIGAEVTDVEEMEMPDESLVPVQTYDSDNGKYINTLPDGVIEPPRHLDPRRTRQQEDTLYGYRVKTTQGACDLIFRNSSNGYYGGTAAWATITSLPDNVEQITEDWSV